MLPLTPRVGLKSSPQRKSKVRDEEREIPDHTEIQPCLEPALPCTFRVWRQQARGRSVLHSLTWVLPRGTERFLADAENLG